jgi:sec-independent protein translocase protein TatB
MGSVGWAEVAVIMVIGLFVLGPERLPSAAAEAGRALRQVRHYLKGMTDDLKADLGPEMQNVDLASLHPRTFVQKHLLSEDDDEIDVPGQRRAATAVPLGPGEPPPWDPDTT